MGNDLYWKITPKLEEDTHQLYYSTWYFLKDLFKQYDLNDLQGKVLDMRYLTDLQTVLLTAKISNNKELVEDMEELITSIEKYKSITLEIHG